MISTTTKSNKLGKGIASLLSDLPNLNIENESLGNQNSQLLIPVEEIVINFNQPRKVFHSDRLNELAISIKENGIIQPLVVEKLNDTYHLISGERRLRASKLAGIKSVPVIFKRVTAKEKSIMALVENIQREDLNCVDEAMSYFGLIDDYKLTQDELAKKIGKNRSSIANFLRLLKLPKEVLLFLRESKLSFGHGKVLATVSDNRERCINLANIAFDEHLSVRELELKCNIREKNSKSNYESKAVDTKHFLDHIEEKTGFHCDLKMNNKGKGRVVLKFENKEQFEEIYNYLLKH